MADEPYHVIPVRHYWRDILHAEGKNIENNSSQIGDDRELLLNFL